MKVVVCRTRFADYNVGERLILRSILEKLSTVPDIHITVVTNTPTLTKDVHGVSVADCSLLHYYQAASAIRCSDLVLWGGGNMLQEQFTYLHIPFAAKDLLQAKMLGKKIFIYAVEVGPIVSLIGRFMARIILRNTDMITVRNIQSFRIARELGAKDHQVFLTEDPVFSISTNGLPDREEVLDRFGLRGKRPMVGICPRIILDKKRAYLPFSLKMKYGLLSHEFHHRHSRVRDFMVQVCRFLIDEAKIDVVFLPMDMSDEAFCDEIIAASQRDMVKASPSSLKLKEVMALFGLMDLVISMRLHGLILASRLVIPIISISGVTKNVNFLSRLGCEENNIDIDDLSVEKFREVFNHLWPNRVLNKQKLQTIITSMRIEEEKNFVLLRDFLEGVSYKS